MNKTKRPKYDKEKEMEKKEQLTKLVPANGKYTSFKFHNVIYKIGCSLIVKDKKNTTSIGKLLRIIPHHGIKQYFWPSIKVQWYYTKHEINREKNGLKSNDLFSCLSEYELYLSKHTDIILIETIISKCYVLSFDDYLSLKCASEITYFTRANYDHIKDILQPPFNQWPTICICKRPYNPDNITFICEECNQCFHPKCFQLNEESSASIDKFYCNNCKEGKTTPKKDGRSSPNNDCLTSI